MSDLRIRTPHGQSIPLGWGRAGLFQTDLKCGAPIYHKFNVIGSMLGPWHQRGKARRDRRARLEKLRGGLASLLSSFAEGFLLSVFPFSLCLCLCVSLCLYLCLSPCVSLFSFPLPLQADFLVLGCLGRVFTMVIWKNTIESTIGIFASLAHSVGS